MNVYYLGPEQSYSHILAHQACRRRDQTLVPLKNFNEIFQYTRRHADSWGVLPIENSTTSSVHESYDLLFSGQLQIVAEASLKIRLAVLGLDGANLEYARAVHSHPQALAQCSEFIAEHQLETVEHPSTTQAAQHVALAGDPSQLVIGDQSLARLHQLVVYKAAAGNHELNMTRFIMVSLTANPETKPYNKLTLVFHFPQDRPGTLATMLQAIARVPRANLTKIESQPVPGTNWQYRFWIDIQIDPHTKNKVIAAVADNTAEFTLLGQYNRGETYESRLTGE